MLDFGDPPLEPALLTLLNSLETEANLHPFGWFRMRVHILDLLETRLTLVEPWRKDLDRLQAVPITRPVFVIGMPRSGSTFLHELLAKDPANRAPWVWEIMFPNAKARAGAIDQQRRIRKTEWCLWWFRKLAPEAEAVYPIRASTPQECVASR